MIEVRGTIYVACRGNFYTGGPELLHQLVYKLTKFGKKAKMYYFTKSEVNPVHPNLAKYGCEYVESVPDLPENCLIVPEVDTRLLRRYSKLKKVIWWLSVDNYELATGTRTRIFESLGLHTRFNFSNKRHRASVLHLCQSQYAMDFIKSKGLDSYKLSDYLSSNIIESADRYASTSQRKDVVLYNPKKGMEFTKLLLKEAQDLKWVAIENRTPQEVADLLLQAKVYIDFGYHPGKDRFPREAAVSGCCVITGRKGSAQNQIDIPIQDKYKIVDDIKNIPTIVKLIRTCIKNYEVALKDFEKYRLIIQEEEKVFETDVKQIFGL